MPVIDTEKNVLTAEEILRSAEKIHQNIDEDKAFENSLARFMDDTQEKTNNPITIGTTPNSLIIAGADGDLPLIINPETILKCIGNPEEVHHGHSLSKETLEQLPSELRNPALILKGSHEGSLVAVTELKDKEKNGIIVAVEMNSRKGRQEVNRISSAYGKENFARYLDAQVNVNRNLIACNQEKADKMFQSLGLQLPPEETFISFNDSIAYSTQNVKYPQENNLEQEQSAERPATEKLLPFLNAKANNLNAKLEVRAEKIEAQENAIAQREAKIDKLSARADRLEDMNQMLKSTVGSLPFVQKLIERNENKISKIRTQQIPRQEEKIKEHDNAILQLEKESSVIQHKLDRCIALNDTIRSFTISNNAERRQKFAQAMDNLHTSTLNCMIDKRAELREQAAYLANRYNEVTYAIDKASIASTIRKTNNRIDKLTDKINTLSGATTPVTGRTDAQIDTAMKNTTNKLSEHMEKGELSMPAVSESVCEVVFVQPEQQREQDNPLKNAEMAIEDDYNSIDGIINNGKKEVDTPQQYAEMPSNETSQPVTETQKEAENSKETFTSGNSLITIQPEEIAYIILDDLEKQGISYIAIPHDDDDSVEVIVSPKQQASLDAAIEAAKQQREQDNPLKNAEMAIEDDYNSIDGIINNGKKEVDTPQQSEKSPSNEASKPVAETQKEAENSKRTISGSINQGYYRSLAPSDRLITIQPREVAERMMSRLEFENVQFSAVSKANDMVALTVSKSDEAVLRSVEEAAINDNGTFMKFLNREHDNLRDESHFNQHDLTEFEARSISDQLTKKGIANTAMLNADESMVTISTKDAQKAMPFMSSSDLITVQPNKIAHKIMDNLNKQGITYSAQPRNNKVFITVSPKDQPALDSAREAAKQQQCKEFINSDYYKSLPKEERFTQRMSESDARSAIQQLADKGIEHSAVLAGRKSAVTVSIKDEQKARPYLSNKQRQKEAQRIKQQPKHEKTPEMQHEKKQEIG